MKNCEVLYIGFHEDKSIQNLFCIEKVAVIAVYDGLRSAGDTLECPEHHPENSLSF